MRRRKSQKIRWQRCRCCATLRRRHQRLQRSQKTTCQIQAPCWPSPGLVIKQCPATLLLNVPFVILLLYQKAPTDIILARCISRRIPGRQLEAELEEEEEED